MIFRFVYKFKLVLNVLIIINLDPKRSKLYISFTIISIDFFSCQYFLVANIAQNMKFVKILYKESQIYF